MVEATNAAFSFQEFKVSQFAYDENNYNGGKLKIGFNPSGIYNVSQGEYELTLNFIAYVEGFEENPVFQLSSLAKFKFNSILPIESIPDYFYKNAVAIMYPYLRAFVSTVTLQANTKLLKLSIMNLSAMEKVLKENTKIKE